MKVSDIKTIYELIKDASHVHILIISFLALPFVLDAWISFFQKIPALAGKELDALYIVFFALSFLMIFAILNDRKRKKIELTKDQVVAYLVSNNFTRVSFEKFNEKHANSYTESELLEVIYTYPQLLRVSSVSIKNDKGEKQKDENGKVKTKPGFGLIDV